MVTGLQGDRLKKRRKFVRVTLSLNRSVPMSRARILIADDNPEGAELLEAYLDGADYDIDTARDGEDTLRKVQAFPPDLILLDVMMPKISGFEVCKRIKANPQTRDIIIHMITAL